MTTRRPTIVLAECDDRLYLVEVGAIAEQDQLAGSQPGGRVPERTRQLELVPAWAAGDLIDVDAVGSTVVLLLDRRPPLAVSHDRGQTWSERGAGLPRGHAVALGANPDHILVGARSRLHVSGDGGRSWRALAVRLSRVRDVAWGRI
jgi:photosystem II stability/assembly factor-like uncharacterized protein